MREIYRQREHSCVCESVCLLVSDSTRSRLIQHSRLCYLNLFGRLSIVRFWRSSCPMEFQMNFMRYSWFCFCVSFCCWWIKPKPRKEVWHKEQKGPDYTIDLVNETKRDLICSCVCGNNQHTHSPKKRPTTAQKWHTTQHIPHRPFCWRLFMRW